MPSLQTDSDARFSIGRLILVPALITLAVTLLRLTGELQHWSRAWFTTDMGASIVGIVWLAPVFGVYFAIRLDAAGQGPSPMWRAILLAVAGVTIILETGYLTSAFGFDSSFHARLLFGWSAFALAALVTLPGWPALFKTLVAYGPTVRIPVAIIMFFAYRGNWGTHYDAAPPDTRWELASSRSILWLGFFPQLVLWVAFTIVAGMAAGTIATAFVRLTRLLTRR